VAARVSTDPRATEMLLNALVALGLLTKTAGLFQNTAEAARYFGEGSPECARPGLMHTVHLWTRWSNLTDCVRAGTAVTFEEMPDRGQDWTEAFIAAMDRNAAERAPHVVRAVGTGGVRRMLDVGGGSAAYAIAFARASSDLHADVFDLEQVTRIAERNIEKAGLAGRVTTRMGDLRTDRLGAGYDLVLVSQICHMLGVAENRVLLRNCFEATGPGGRTVVQDFVLEPDKTAPKNAALFALNMLVGTREGSAYSADEYIGWMKAAGFHSAEHVRLPGPSALIIGSHAPP
jgi:hypothetical protein